MALSFSGSGQYLSRGSAIASSYPCSFACWYNPASNAGSQVLISSGNTSVNSHLVIFSSSGILTAKCANATPASGAASSIASLTVGSWNHCVGVFANATSRLCYLNGVSSSNATSVALSALNQTSVGADFFNSPIASSLVIGSIAYPTMWNFALTPTDVSTLYNAGLGYNPNNVESANLISFSPLQSGPPYFDSITTAAWTITGSPVLVSDPFSLSTSLFPLSVDTFKTIPNPSTTPTSLVDANDDNLSTRLQQHSDSIFAVQNWLINNTIAEPTGVVKAFAGTTAPPGYLLCNGGTVNRVTFSALFGVIGTTFGSGDGSTTFNVPNLSGSVPIGTGTAPTGTTNRVLAAAGGEEKHTLSLAELTSHNHTQNAHSHTDSGHVHFDNGHGHTDSGHVHFDNGHGHGDSGHAHFDNGHGHTDTGHTHGYIGVGTGTGLTSGGNWSIDSTQTGVGSANLSVGHASITSASANITAGFASITAASAAITTGFASITAASANITAQTASNNAVGSSTPFNVTQPFLVLNWIIKA